MADFGGLMRFTYNANPIKVRGRVETEPTGSQYDAEHNQDGSYDRMVKPMGPMADIEFVDSVDGSATALDWDTIMAGSNYNMTLFEVSNNWTHTWTGASFVGRAKIDELKGTVTGIRIQAPVGGYKKISTS